MGRGRNLLLGHCLATLLASLAVGCPAPVHVRESWTVLGEPFSAELHATSAATAEECLASIRGHLADVEASVGWQVPESELTRLNQAAVGEYYKVQDAGLYRLIRLALDYAQFTRGAYDPTLGPIVRLHGRASGRLPTETELAIALDRVGWDKVVVAPEARAVRLTRPGMELDLGGLPQAYALDVAGRAFARVGTRAGLLRLGDSILAWNKPPQSDAWSVPIHDPRAPQSALLTLAVANRGLAVVGHPTNGRATVFDARTGRPAASDLLAVIAIADSAADATALARALLVGGSSSSGQMLERMIRAEALLLLAGNGKPVLMASASLKGRVELSPALAAEVEDRVRYILPPERIGLESPLKSWSPSD